MNGTAQKNLIATAVLLAGAGLLVWSVWSFIQGNFPQWLGLSDGQPAVKVAETGDRAPIQYNVNTITSAHLFGKVMTAAPTTEKAPETKLKLKLLGVLASPQKKYARALIQVASNEMKVYSVGDAIEGTDAGLHQVEPHRVIIERNGTLETLAMFRETAPVSQAPGGEPESEGGEPVMDDLMKRARLASDVQLPGAFSRSLSDARSSVWARRVSGSG